MSQPKEEFLENVRYWASCVAEREEWLAQCPSRENPVDLDPELREIYAEAERYERLMCEAAVRLSKRCAEKLREVKP